MVFMVCCKILRWWMKDVVLVTSVLQKSLALCAAKLLIFCHALLLVKISQMSKPGDITSANSHKTSQFNK